MLAATCQLHERAAAVAQRIEGSPYGFALVLSDEGVLLGRIRRSALGKSGALAEELMEPGPATVRVHTEAGELAERLRDRDLTTAIVTTPRGQLIGVVTRKALEAV